MSGPSLRGLRTAAIWAGTFGVVLSAHLGAMVWVLGQADAGAPPGLPEAVFVDLAPALQDPAAAAPSTAPAAGGDAAVPEPDTASDAELPPSEPEPEPEQVAEPIDPATLDLPQLRDFTPPEIQPDTPVEAALALDRSSRPHQRPRRQPDPAPEPQPQRQLQPEPQPETQSRRAAPSAQMAGQGGQADVRASSGNAQGGGASAQARVDAMSRWGAQIGSCIQRRAALPRNVRQGGRVVLALTVARGGAIQGVGVAGSSGVASVDQAAVTAAQRAGRCPGAPAALGDASYSFQLPITLNLR